MFLRKREPMSEYIENLKIEFWLTPSKQPYHDITTSRNDIKNSSSALQLEKF